MAVDLAMYYSPEALLITFGSYPTGYTKKSGLTRPDLACASGQPLRLFTPFLYAMVVRNADLVVKKRIQAASAVRVCSLSGGDKRNALPREAQAVVVVPNADVPAVQQAIAQTVEELQAEYGLLEKHSPRWHLHKVNKHTRVQVDANLHSPSLPPMRAHIHMRCTKGPIVSTKGVHLDWTCASGIECAEM
eukprot:1051182-Pelagomonas_calceolata.AAC.4